MNLNKNDCFLEGEIVYLRLPDIQKDIYEGNWHQWFNDPDITRYLIHGVYPINREKEAHIIEQEIKKTNSIVLSIIYKENHQHIGVISLKNIDLINRNAEIGIVMGVQTIMGSALEAMALLTKHSFDKLNLIKIYAGQHEGLWKWINTLELIGYRIEGYRHNSGIRFGQSYGVVLTSVDGEDFYELKKKRWKYLKQLITRFT
ncbi:GNAT family N-acetyltransferase [Nostoc sp.]|uniref:GNAT family N-acetyltransferase n=1 Tax=Nostoc sp. TaxID=1180 RepID=UPI002FF969E2